MPTPVPIDKLVVGEQYLIKYAREFVAEREAAYKLKYAIWEGIHSQAGEAAGPPPEEDQVHGWLATGVFRGKDDAKGTITFGNFQIVKHPDNPADLPPIEPEASFRNDAFEYASLKSATDRRAVEQLVRQKGLPPAVGVEIARALNAHDPFSMYTGEDDHNPWSAALPRPPPGNPSAPAYAAAAGEGFVPAVEGVSPAGRLAAAEAERTAEANELDADVAAASHRGWRIGAKARSAALQRAKDQHEPYEHIAESRHELGRDPHDKISHIADARNGGRRRRHTRRLKRRGRKSRRRV